MLPQLQTALATLTLCLGILSQLSTTISYSALPVQAQAPEDLPKPSRTLSIPERIDAATLAAGIPQLDRENLKLAAWCESSFRQFASDGQPLPGIAHPADKGLFQLNSAVHALPFATIDENIASALVLYKRSGMTPWAASKACWGALSTTTIDIVMDAE